MKPQHVALMRAQEAGEFSKLSDAEISWNHEVGVATVRKWRKKNNLPKVPHSNTFSVAGGRASLAYQYRQEGMKWVEIDRLLLTVNSCAMAKEWARKNNKPWPVKTCTTSS